MEFLEFKLLDRVNVHYNIGHLDSMEGKSTKPKGKYGIALKNYLLIDFTSRSTTSTKSQLIDLAGGMERFFFYMIPIVLGEPHECCIYS